MRVWNVSEALLLTQPYLLSSVSSKRMASEAAHVLFLFKPDGVVGFDRHFAGRHARVAGDLRSPLVRKMERNETDRAGLQRRSWVSRNSTYPANSKQSWALVARCLPDQGCGVPQ